MNTVSKCRTILDCTLGSYWTATTVRMIANNIKKLGVWWTNWATWMKNSTTVLWTWCLYSGNGLSASYPWQYVCGMAKLQACTQLRFGASVAVPIQKPMYSAIQSPQLHLLAVHSPSYPFGPAALFRTNWIVHSTAGVNFSKPFVTK